MKILQFIPNPLNKAPDKPSNESASDAAKAGASKTDFAALLKAASAKPPSGPEGPGGTVSQENLRALKLPTADELGRAGQLLNRLNTDIRAATPEALKSVHNLEGLIYVYSKSGV